MFSVKKHSMNATSTLTLREWPKFQRAHTPVVVDGC